ELPVLQSAHAALGGKGLVIIGVHRRSTTESRLRRVAASNDLTFPICIDDSAAATFGQYQINGTPRRVVIGRDGKRSRRDTMANFWVALRNAVLYEDDR